MKITSLLHICCCFLLVSCVNSTQQDQRAQELAQDRFDAIDFSQPDMYPQFEHCVDLNSLENCFYEQLYDRVYQSLNQQPVNFSYVKTDTLLAVMTISTDSVIHYSGLQDQKNLPEFQPIDSLLQSRLTDLGRVAPAIKQGVPVQTSYLLPLVIKPSATTGL